MSSNGRKAPSDSGLSGQLPKKTNKMSDREAQILEQQRLVASRLTTAKTAPVKPASMTKQALLVQKKTQSDKLKTILKKPTSVAIPSFRPQKRPAVRNKALPPPPPMTAAAAIAAAKTRVATTAAISKSTKSAAVPVQGDPVKRKTSQLAQLVSASLQTSAENPPLMTGSYGKVEPDDFWKNMRDWDALTQLARSSSREKTETSSAAAKPLPDTFVGPAHYVAAWAPLCLAEARAQMMSDAAAELRNCRNAIDCFVPVKVQTAMRDSSTLDSVNVQASRKEEQGKQMTFMANDLCVLISAESRDRVELALLKGDPESSLRKHGLVGHVEFRRDSLDGLLLKVSKRWWATVGEKDMYLWKLGSNITALREFTALCRVETIPLRRNLFGQNLVDDAHKKIATHDNPRDMLDAMGGVNALGKGFTNYVKEKFNPSQLAAISASANQYGEGGFTLIKGPPGTGKTLTLVAVLNSLHIRQFNKYYEEVRRIAAMTTGVGNRKVALSSAVRAQPRLLVCAPSNAAVDNIILKIMESGFVDGCGTRYNPSMIRVGTGAGDAVRGVLLENQVDAILSENMDLARLESSISGFKMELQRIQTDLMRLRQRIHALSKASPWPLSKDWEIRIDEESFEETGRVFFVNHKDKTTTFEVPPPPEPDEKHYPATSMPEYRSYMQQIVKLVEKFNSVTTKLERCTIVQSGMGHGNRNGGQLIRQQLETHILDSVHIVMTTLGTAGNWVMESAAKFEVVVVDEAAQCVEPAMLSALQLGSRHAVLVGDPQQLPATIFNVSGRNTKYDRSLFQRLEEAGHKVYMLNQQYRMHPAISHFPRWIFYDGNLLDGPNVLEPEYGNPLRQMLLSKVPALKVRFRSCLQLFTALASMLTLDRMILVP